MSDWFKNDALFEDELRRGHSWAQRLAEALTAQGLTVDLTPLVLRERIEDRQDFANEGDLVVRTARGRLLIESKSRGLAFTSVEDYPYSTALVDTVSGWDQKQDKPWAVVLTSQITEARLVIPVSSKPEWRQVERFDNVRQIRDNFYEVERCRLRPFEELVDRLKMLGPPRPQV